MILESTSCSQYLSEELARRIRQNPRYSQRAFARFLGLSPGELSEVLRGRRKLSLKSSFKISKALGLSAVEAKHLIFLIQKEQGSALGPEEIPAGSPFAEIEKSTIGLDLFRLVANWYCFGILNLSECDDFRWDAQWIAKRLGISTTEVRVAVDRLERAGLIERKNGKLKVTKDFVLSPDGIPSEAVRSFHKQMLSKAAQALELQRIDERDITGVGFAMNPKHLPTIKKEISQFLDDMAQKYGRGKNRREVYQCELALFRVTTRNEHA